MTRRRARKSKASHVPAAEEPVAASPLPPTESSDARPAIAPSTRHAAAPSLGTDVSSQPAKTPQGRRARVVLLWLVAWLLLTAGWTALRQEVLRLPPFEDQAVGLWTEANFLAEHDFDYRRLRNVERHYMDHSDPAHPGTRSYMVSVLPTLVALGMRSLGNVETHLLVEHVIQIALASGVVIGLAALVWHRCGAAVAVAAALALATVPLFGVQAELLGMDISLAAAVLATTSCIAKKRFGWAALGSCVAFLMKPTGLLLTLANVIFVTLSWGTMTSAERARRRLPPAAWVVNLLALLGQVALFIWGGTRPQLPGESLVPWPQLYQLPHAVILFPDVAILVALAAVAALIGLLRWQARPKPHTDLTAEDLPLREWVRELLAQHGTAVYAALALGMVLASLAVWVALPRYLTCAVPLAFLLLVWPVGSRPVGRWLLAGALAVLALFNVANHDGRYFPDVAAWAGDDFSRNAFATPRSCVIQERSREYLAELHACRDLLNFIEQQQPSRPVMLPHPYWYLATQPNLGYVRKPLEAINASHLEPVLAGLERLSAERRVQGDHRAPLLVWTGLSRLTLPQADSPDTVRYQAPGPSPLEVRELPARWRTLSTEEIRQWYFAATRSDEWLAQRTLMRASVLIEHGEVPQALAELREAIDHAPRPSVRLRDALTGMFEQGMERLVAIPPVATSDNAQQHHPQLFAVDAHLARAFDKLQSPVEDRGRSFVLAISQAADQSAPDESPPLPQGTRIEPADLSYRAGIEALESRRLPATRAVWKTALDAGLDAQRADAVRFVLARVELLCGDLARAREHWEAIAPDSPLAPAAHAAIALADVQSGNLSSARDRLNAQSAAAHVEAEGHALRGLLHARAGEHESAGAEFSAAMVADRNDPGIRLLYRGWCWRNASARIRSAEEEATNATAP